MSNDVDDPAYEAFEQAQKAFRNKIVNVRQYDEVLKKTTIDDVYQETVEIQKALASKGQLRYLKKIEPFLKGVQELASVIEVFVQVKPELLALIWGPIKLILHFASKSAGVLDKVAEAMVSIGEALPRFARLAQTFPTSNIIRAALELYYENVLDFYSIIINVLQTHTWKQKFDVLWHGTREKIEVTKKSLQKQERLLREEVTLLDIIEAKEARTRDLEHFAKMKTSERQSKYLALKSRISPALHDDQLDWLQERSVAGCESWLFREGDFQEWAIPTEEKRRWWWLHGIPGAGKTYLAASAVGRVRYDGLTLFAFVSHKNGATLNARSVMLSLIFQAAEEDTALQSVLVEANEREIRGQTSQVTLLLQNYLASAGLIYIVIDGLDEMEESERQILLQRLDEVAQECDNIRLLICSRDEHDIARVLREKADSTRVDHKNWEAIQIYIDHRIDTLIDDRRFVPKVATELKRLTADLSEKAKGLFIYVRIVMDGLEHLGSIEEIRSELKVPPKDLQEAYQRIFDRINSLTEKDRRKARKVLGWIGCALAPLTTFEMEQALLIDIDPQPDTDKLPQLLTKMDFVKLCGPIIEVVGDDLQFVHFTVHEYIFSRDIPSFIDEGGAARNFLFTLMSYMATALLDMELDDPDIEENILNGNYRLFEYANFFWPTCLKQIGCSRLEPSEASEVSGPIGRLFNRLIQGGSNEFFEPSTESEKKPLKYPHLEENMPEVFRVANESFQFRLMDKRLDWNRDNSNSWVDYDPLNGSRMLVRLQECHEGLIPTCQSPLTTHYGESLFRCNYPFCPRSYRGFKTQQDRLDHMGYHGKPWKCIDSDCDFFSIGFGSRSRRDKHWGMYHEATSDQEKTARNDPEKLSPSEAQPVLFMLIGKDDFETARRVLESSGGRQLKPEARWRARLKAANRGSLEMTDLLAPPGETFMPLEVVLAAAESRNLDFARVAFFRSQPEDCSKLMVSIIRTDSEEIYALWEEYLLEMEREIPRKNQPPRDMYLELFRGPLLNEINDNPFKEARAKHTLRVLGSRMKAWQLGALLVQVAKSTCSIPMAKELVEMGAPVDHPVGSSSKSMTALQLAAKKTSKEAAFFMKYLISQGASMAKDYHFFYNPDRIRGQRGAQDMWKYVGVTFDEAREEYARQQSVVDLARMWD